LPDLPTVLCNLEPQYFADYISLTGVVRDYVADTLREAFASDPNPTRRRLHLLGLLGQEYAAYEDAAALLKAWLDWRTKTVTSPMETLLKYKPGEARLDRVLSGANIVTGDELYDALGCSTWLPPDWSLWFPSLQLEKTVRLGCQFLAVDCRANQKRFGISAYNKLKHGLLVVPSGQRYEKSLPDSPAAIFLNANKATNSDKPVFVYGFPSTDDKLAERELSIHFVGRTLRLLAALYLLHRFPAKVAATWGASGREMFISRDLASIMELIDEVTRKK
jgi:hypothetical protein